MRPTPCCLNTAPDTHFVTAVPPCPARGRAEPFAGRGPGAVDAAFRPLPSRPATEPPCHTKPHSPPRCERRPPPSYAAPIAVSPPPEALLARIERPGPSALDDHELLGLIDIDIATLAAAGGLRELLLRNEVFGVIHLDNRHRPGARRGAVPRHGGRRHRPSTRRGTARAHAPRRRAHRFSSTPVRLKIWCQRAHVQRCSTPLKLVHLGFEHLVLALIDSIVAGKAPAWRLWPAQPSSASAAR